MRVVVSGGALALHRAGQSCAETDPFFFLRIDAAVVPIAAVVRVQTTFGLQLRVGVHTLLHEDEFGPERRGLLFRCLSSFQGSGKLCAEAAVVDRGLGRIAALSREPQFRTRSFFASASSPAAAERRTA